jgi:hypothetical protein
VDYPPFCFVPPPHPFPVVLSAGPARTAGPASGDRQAQSGSLVYVVPEEVVTLPTAQTVMLCP